MLTYRELYEKDVWNVGEIKRSIKSSKKIIIFAGSLLREKIAEEENPINWDLEIQLLCELYTTIIQVFYHFDDVAENNYDDEERNIEVGNNERVILEAFSSNIELCQSELQNKFYLSFPTNSSFYN